MQLELKHEERSDNKAIVFTDISPWTNIAEAQAAVAGLTLVIVPYQGIVYEVSNAILTDAINTATTVGEASDIVFTIEGNSIGLTSGSLIPDSIYQIVYDHASHDEYDKNIIVYGQAKQKVWQRLAAIDDAYLETKMFSHEIEKALVDYAFLLDLESSTYCAQISELDKLLKILNNLN